MDEQTEQIQSTVKDLLAKLKEVPGDYLLEEFKIKARNAKFKESLVIEYKFEK